MKHLVFLSFGIIVLFLACTPDSIEKVEGLKPVYKNKTDYQMIQYMPAKPFSKVGKIYTYGNKIYISDTHSGVHVIDNSNPASPSKEAFISLFGNNDMAIKDFTMYADNGKDLVAIDISSINNVSVSKRMQDVYVVNSSTFPFGYSGYFECVDDEKGIAYEWVKATLENPKCKR